MTEQVLFSTQGPICRHQQLARSCEWCEIERDRDQWRDRCQEAQVQAQAARAERDNARAEVTELRGTPVFRQLHQQCQQVERVVAERDAARAEVTALKARAAHLEYAASGVGCRMLSQGEGCQCRLCELERRAEQAEAEVARLKVALVQARLFVDTTALMAEDPFVKASAMKVRAQVDAALAAKAGACE